MITVEDLLKALCDLIPNGHIKGEWHKNFLTSVHGHVLNGNALSTNQAENVLKIARNSMTNLGKVLRKSQRELEATINNPTYRKQPYTSVSIKREVRHAGADKLVFRFKHDPTVIADLKALKSNTDFVLTRSEFNDDYRVWVVTVTPGNLDKVFNLIKRHRFDFDAPVLEYMHRCANSKDVASEFVLHEGSFVGNVAGNPLLAYVVKNILKGEVV